jgi:hypothetical protein
VTQAVGAWTVSIRPGFDLAADPGSTGSATQRSNGHARALEYRRPRRPGGAAHESGVWFGPTSAEWVTRILAGAPAPRESTGSASGPLVAHG